MNLITFSLRDNMDNARAFLEYNPQNGQFSAFVTPETVKAARDSANLQGVKTLRNLGILAGVGTVAGLGAGIRDRSLAREYDKRAVRRANQLQGKYEQVASRRGAANFAFMSKRLPPVGGTSTTLLSDLANEQAKEDFFRTAGLLASIPVTYAGVKSGYGYGTSIKNKIRDKKAKKAQG
jgi:hypothetical protein